MALTGASSDDGITGRLTAIEARLAGLERAAADARRRQVLAELRQDPSRLLAGMAEIRRIVPEQLDELTDVLARWDVALSPEERADLQQTGLVARCADGASNAKVQLVVDVVSAVTLADLERSAKRSRIFTTRNRRSIAIVITLEPPSAEVRREAAHLGVELRTDS